MSNKSYKLQIRDLNFKNENGREQPFVPKTSTEAVIDEITNQRLSEILLNKINKSDLATINGIDLTQGGNIVISGSGGTSGGDIYVGKLEGDKFICLDGSIAIKATNKLYIDNSIQELIKLYIWDKNFIEIYKEPIDVLEDINILNKKFEDDNTVPGSVRYIAKEEATDVMSWKE